MAAIVVGDNKIRIFKSALNKDCMKTIATNEYGIHSGANLFPFSEGDKSVFFYFRKAENG